MIFQEKIPMAFSVLLAIRWWPNLWFFKRIKINLLHLYGTWSQILYTIILLHKSGKPYYPTII